MKVTVIYDDHFISVDGNGIHFEDNWPFDEDYIHAIQWYETEGQLEYRNNDPNLPITSQKDVQKYIDHFKIAYDKIVAKRKKDEEEEAKRIELWNLAMRELQQELNETKINYDNTRAGLEAANQNIMSLNQDLMQANEMNMEIQRMQERIVQDGLNITPDDIVDIINPHVVIGNLAEFSDGVDMGVFDGEMSPQEEDPSVLSEINSDFEDFDLSLLEDEFNIELLDDEEPVIENSIEKLVDEEPVIENNIEQLVDEIDGLIFQTEEENYKLNS